MNSVHTAMAKSGLVRGDDRWLGGVCSGLAAKFGTDTAAVRLVMVLLLLLPGSQLIIYPLLWFVMPDQPTARRLLSAGEPQPAPPYFTNPANGTGPQDTIH
ncbi:MAG: PspC domain-containing protein [Austwickia sp.]|jgi:phage shock protein C|nr:MAG: PspC domain-containing protein [Austwickia sp.]